MGIKIGDKMQFTGEVTEIRYKDEGEGILPYYVDIRLDQRPLGKNLYYTLTVDLHAAEGASIEPE